MASYALLLPCLIAVVFASRSTSGEPIKFDNCGDTEAPRCDITNVKIDPCPEAATDEPCKIKRGNSATLTYNFTPRWAPGSGELKTRAYWASVLDLPFLGMDTDVCKYATCPIVKDQQNFYNFTLEIEKRYPAQRYNIKFRIWEDEAEPKKECCIVFKLKLT
uniref:MD-2-related lipid-recognition protein n=1 Tax=Lygus hesperus TaxID=30085 RepID=A0A0A9YQB5_LYGHE